MKKFVKIIILTLVIFFMFDKNVVVAKDNVYSLNKYSEEIYNFILKSYNDKGFVDGQLVGGTILKNTFEVGENEYNDYQAIIVKYDINGNIKWKYLYGDNKEDYLYSLSYTYDSEGKIDGYLLVTEETGNIDNIDLNNKKIVFLKIDFEGKLVWKKDALLNSNEIINKVIPTTNKDNIVDGYITMGNYSDSVGILVKYDCDFNIIWKKSLDNTIYKDLTLIKDKNIIIGYALIRNYSSQEQLVRYNLEGNETKVLNESLDKYKSYYLSEANDGFILYGSTPEVKLKNGEDSYYIINYNINDEEYWETIGDVSIDKSKKIIIKPLYKNNIIKEYLLLYSNSSNNTEIIKIDNDGMIKEKIKKIYSEYYDIESFNINNNVLYLVGQINCPKDDTCDYDANSLYLVSDEDKVIEVKDNTGRNIIIGFCIFIVLIIGLVFYNNKKKLN